MVQTLQKWDSLLLCVRLHTEICFQLTTTSQLELCKMLVLLCASPLEDVHYSSVNILAVSPFCSRSRGFLLHIRKTAIHVYIQFNMSHCRKLCIYLYVYQSCAHACVCVYLNLQQSLYIDVQYMVIVELCHLSENKYIQIHLYL